MYREYTRRIIIGCFIVVGVLLSGCATTNVAMDQQYGDKCVKLGQEWTYDTRKGEEDSRLTIVDAFINKDRVRFYVVRVTGVKIDDPNFENYFPDRIPYFLISEAGLNQTLRTMVGESSWNKFFDTNYKRWSRQLSQPDYYGFTIKDKLNTIEELLNTKLGA